jgi:hypothetical protein
MKLKGITRRLWTCIKSNNLKFKEFLIQKTFKYKNTGHNTNKSNVYRWDSPDQVRPTQINSERLFSSKTWHLLFSNLKKIYNMNRRKAIKSIMAIGAISASPQLLLGKTESTSPTHFIGLGKGGYHIVQHFLKQNPKGKYTCISYYKPQKLDPRIQFVQIPPSGKVIYPFGDPFHFPPQPGAKVQLTNEVLQLVKANDKFVLLAGLGGFTASNLAKELTLMLHAENKDFQTICSLPFTFEGTKRRQNATKALSAIKHLPQVKYFELDSLKQKYGDLALSNAFDRVSREFWDTFRS